MATTLKQLKSMNEMPRLIDNIAKFDNELSDIDKNKKLTSKLKPFDNSTKLFKQNGLWVYSKGNLKNKGKIFQIDFDADIPFTTYYASVVQTSGYKGLKGTTQIAIWRDSSSSYFGVASKVFFETLLPLHNTIISDSVQTNDGKRFWLRVMGEALSKKLQVGVYDKKRNLFELFSGNKVELYKWATETVKGWGYTEKNEYTRFFITKSL